MKEKLIAMRGKRIPSITGRVIYTVTSVLPNVSVTLESPRRKKPSVLPWESIEKVYREAKSGKTITPTVVDRILSDPYYHDSSTMCALVLALMNPKRVR